MSKDTDKKLQDASSEVSNEDLVLQGEEEIVELPEKPVEKPLATLIPVDEIAIVSSIRHSPERVEQLASSVRTRGLLQPIMVRPAHDKSHGKKYELVLGSRRKAAFEFLSRPEIPAIIRETMEEDMLADMITENFQREPHSPMAEARAMQQMIDLNGWTHAQVAAHLNVHRTQVTKRLALLDLPDEIRDWVDEGKLSPSHAEVITSIDKPEAQIEVAELAVSTQAPVAKLASWTQKIKETIKHDAEIADAVEAAQHGDESIDMDAITSVATPATPMDKLMPQDVTPLPHMKLDSKLTKAQLQRAELYTLLRASNDTEMLEYLQEHFSVEYEDLWDWVCRLNDTQVKNQVEVMIRRWLQAAHRYPTFPSSLVEELGKESVIGPVPVEVPEVDMEGDEPWEDEAEEDWDNDWDDDWDGDNE